MIHLVQINPFSRRFIIDNPNEHITIYIRCIHSVDSTT